MPDYKLSQLLLSSSKKNSICDIYIAQPDSFKEELAGRLFIVIEINSLKHHYQKVKDFLINNIDKNYYQNEKIIIRERMPSITVEHIFEATLAKVNKNFADFLQDEKLKIDLNDLNITIGVIFEDEIHAANCGKNKFLIIHKTKKNNQFQNSDEPDYKIADVFKKSPSDEQVSEEKLFTNVISGKITNNSCFLVANETLPEYISNKELIKIITTLPPAGATEQIKNILKNINAYVSFLAIVIKNSSFEYAPPTAIVFNQPIKDSVVNLQSIENKTEKILMPSGPINIKKFPKLQIKLPFLSSSQTNSSAVLNLKDKIFMKKKAFILTGLYSNILNGLNIVFRAAIIFYNFLKKSLKLENILTLGDRLNFLSFLRRLNLKSKIIFAVAAIFIIFFFLNTSKKNVENQKISNNVEFSNLIKEIEQKQNQAEANLLYNNEKGAAETLNEINSLIEKLPRESEGQKNKYAELKKKSDEQLLKIRKIVKMENLKEIASFQKIDPNITMENLIMTGDKIFAADSVHGQIYAIDPINSLISQSSSSSAQATELKFPVYYNNLIYYLDNSNIKEYDPKNYSLKNIEIKTDTKLDVSTFNFFGTNAYLVSKNDNNIIRFKKTATELNTPKQWLNKTNEALTKAVDMYIDGNIYILTSDGQILKFLKGAELEFNIDKADPPIANASKLLMSNELNNIYIFEAKENRLVVFDKKGKFKNQYQITAPAELKDFSIDEKKKTIYLLTTNSLYSAEIGAQ